MTRPLPLLLRVALLLLAAAVVFLLVGRAQLEALRAAGDAVTAQLAGDLQAAFDPSTLQPAANPSGAQFLVVADGAVLASGGLPLGTRAESLLDGGLPVADRDGFLTTVREAVDDDGRAHTLVAFVPTLGRDAGRVPLGLGLLGLTVLALALHLQVDRSWRMVQADHHDDGRGAGT